MRNSFCTRFILLKLTPINPSFPNRIPLFMNQKNTKTLIKLSVTMGCVIAASVTGRKEQPSLVKR